MANRKSFDFDKKYGYWTPIKEGKGFLNNKGYIDRTILCKCECEVKREVLTASLKSGVSKSCGCYQKDRMTEIKTTHGLRQHKFYSVWKGIISRCYKPKNTNYHNYGGRGINVCSEWRDTPEIFLGWLEQNGYRKGLEVDRIDNNKGYSPENCRWVTAKESSLNRRNNRFLAFQEKIQTVSEWADELGINKTTITHRLDGGHAVEDVLSHSPLKRGVSVGYSRKLSEETLYLSYRGDRKTVLEWSLLLGIPVSSIYYRLRKGLPITEVLSITKFKPGPRKNISSS
jgi:hypothetical protein